MVVMALLVWPSCLKTCDARKGKQNLRPSKVAPIRKETLAGNIRGVSKFKEGNYITAQKDGGNSAIFNVLNYGAKGDGHADDTKVIS